MDIYVRKSKWSTVVIYTFDNIGSKKMHIKLECNRKTYMFFFSPFFHELQFKSKQSKVKYFRWRKSVQIRIHRPSMNRKNTVETPNKPTSTNLLTDILSPVETLA